MLGAADGERTLATSGLQFSCWTFWVFRITSCHVSAELPRSHWQHSHGGPAHQPCALVNTSEPWFPCLGNGENNPHLIHRVWDAGKDWRQEEKGTTEEEMVGWHHQLDGHEFGQAPGIGDRQGSLACCSPWGRKELDTTERLNWLRLQSQGTLKIIKGYTVNY